MLLWVYPVVDYHKVEVVGLEKVEYIFGFLEGDAWSSEGQFIELFRGKW